MFSAIFNCNFVISKENSFKLPPPLPLIEAAINIPLIQTRSLNVLLSDINLVLFRFKNRRVNMNDNGACWFHITLLHRGDNSIQTCDDEFLP